MAGATTWDDSPLALTVVAFLGGRPLVESASLGQLIENTFKARRIEYLVGDGRLRLWVSEPGYPSEVVTVKTPLPEVLARWIADNLALKGVEIVNAGVEAV